MFNFRIVFNSSIFIPKECTFMPEENTPLHGRLSFESLNLLKANLCARAKIKGHTTPTSNDLLKPCLKGFLRRLHQFIRMQRL